MHMSIRIYIHTRMHTVSAGAACPSLVRKRQSSHRIDYKTSVEQQDHGSIFDQYQTDASRAANISKQAASEQPQCVRLNNREHFARHITQQHASAGLIVDVYMCMYMCESETQTQTQTQI
jgi:hypothetical protein